MRVCPTCGRENADDARFCSDCGASLEQAAAREERKVVSVLFADLVGFTSQAEQMDPEDVRALVAPYYAHVRGELERHGGTVEKFIGDAVMALFGAPVAHEDDPERAVRAALTIRDWVRDQGGTLHLRIAVGTGEALVTLDARPNEGEGMASGDVINTAARLQSAAPIDGVLVDETTYRATSQAIEYREVHPVEAKGKAQPVPAWEAVEARSRFGVDTVQRAGAPLIGRDRELDTVVAAFARAREERAPQLVTVVGVPGIGKSRLVYELFRAVEDEPDLIFWRQGRSLPYGEGVSYWALGEIVKAHAGILETDPPAAASEKLHQSLPGHLRDDAEWVERHLEPLVGLGGEQELHGDHRAEAFAAWRRFIEATADVRPLVLVFEDLHWADDGLLDFIDHLIEWAVGVPILLICTARPELLARRPGWGGGKPNALTLSLSPLDDEQTARLISALLERSVLPAETQVTLLQRAGGNPLYAEEFVRMMADRGLLEGDDELPLPESVQGIVAARLDALSEEEKTLLQDASVVGKVFWLGTVAGVGDLEPRAAQERLHRLERKEFVRRQQRSSVAAETEYSFRHLLVRDVAYGQIPRARRAEKHRLTAEWIESLGRPDDHAEMLAHHYLTALELAQASGAETDSLADPARFALREAADRAQSLGGYGSAKRFYEAALELWPAEDQGQPKLLFNYASVVNRIEHDGASELLEHARDALLVAGDPDTAAEAEVLLGEVFWNHGERDECFACLRRAEALLEGRPTTFSKANVVETIARFQMLAGEGEAAISLGRAALAMVEELGGNEELRASALNDIGVARMYGGDASGLADLERSVEIALAMNSVEVIRGYGNLASLLADLGELERRNEMLAKGRATAESFGVGERIRWLTGESTLQLYWNGNWGEAHARLDELIAEFEKTNFWMETPCRWTRGRMRLASGDSSGARTDAERAIERGRSVKDPQILWPALAFGARVLTAVDPEEARRLSQEMLAGWRDQRFYGAGASEWLGDIAVALRAIGEGGALAEAAPLSPLSTPWLSAASSYAAGDFRDAAETYASIGSMPDEAYARLRAAEALVLEGRRVEANVELESALAFWRSVGAAAYVREGEALLAVSA
ncbi:MAG: AAA family ATPase [Gaiellaceae bacterium]